MNRKMNQCENFKKKLTFGGGSEQNETVVQVLAIALETEIGIVSKLEIEVEAARFERLEENGVG